MADKTSVDFQRWTREEGRIVVDVLNLKEHISKPGKSRPSLIRGEDEESPGRALLTVQTALCIDPSSSFVDGELATSALTMEGVAEGGLIGLLVRICGRDLKRTNPNIRQLLLT